MNRGVEVDVVADVERQPQVQVAPDDEQVVRRARDGLVDALVEGAPRRSSGGEDWVQGAGRQRVTIETANAMEQLEVGGGSQRQRPLSGGHDEAEAAIDAEVHTGSSRAMT